MSRSCSRGLLCGWMDSIVLLARLLVLRRLGYVGHLIRQEIASWFPADVLSAAFDVMNMMSNERNLSL